MLGARPANPPGLRCKVLLDPAGHPFCITTLVPPLELLATWATQVGVRGAGWPLFSSGGEPRGTGVHRALFVVAGGRGYGYRLSVSVWFCGMLGVDNSAGSWMSGNEARGVTSSGSGDCTCGGTTCSQRGRGLATG